ncbi:uncharacterized protein DMAD_00839 [Drosophila madeirensis]|uniref:Uncharacterized protein n=1 Tax=Drosophila madeirensis TaxID=30013 RepID=A0AAU9FXW7_DROMD
MGVISQIVDYFSPPPEPELTYYELILEMIKQPWDYLQTLSAAYPYGPMAMLCVCTGLLLYAKDVIKMPRRLFNGNGVPQVVQNEEEHGVEEHVDEEHGEEDGQEDEEFEDYQEEFEVSDEEFED